MLREAIASWFRPTSGDDEPVESRAAYHSDIRELRPDVWSSDAPNARGVDVEQALWLSGVSTRDFARTVDIALSPRRVAPVDDIVAICGRRAMACKERADALTAELPPPNLHGRPPLPWHRATAREASRLHRAADAWRSLRELLLNNRWHE